MEVIIETGEKTNQFVTIFQHLRTKINDANIIFDEEKLYMQGMDPSQIGLFELKLQKDWFKKYEVTKSVTLGINCELFHKMLNCIAKTQEIILNFNEEGDDLAIHFKSEEKGVIDKHFSLPLIDIDVALMNIPPTEYSADIEFPSAIFEKMIEQLLIFAKTLKITCTEEEVLLETTKETANDCAQMEAKINIDDMTEYTIEEELTLHLTFSLDYLNWMVQFSKLSPQVSIHFKKDIPMKLRHDLDDNGYIQFFLAPQYEDY